MSDDTTNTGLSFCTILLIIFLVLKLVEIGPVAHWSWWWVTAPLWIPWGIIGSIFLIAGIAWVIRAVGHWWIRRGNMKRVMED